MLSSTYQRRGACAGDGEGIVGRDSGGDSTTAAAVVAAAAAVRPFRVGGDAGWVERARGRRVGQVEENSSPAAGDVSARAEVSQQRESRY